MKLFGNCIYQGSVARQGIKDPSKTYYEAALLEGMDQQLFNQTLATIKPFTECKCEFNLNTVYNTLRLVGISPLK